MPQPTFPQWIISLFLFSIQGLAITLTGNAFMFLFSPLLRLYSSDKNLIDQINLAMGASFCVALLFFGLTIAAAKRHLAHNGH